MDVRIGLVYSAARARARAPRRHRRRRPEGRGRRRARRRRRRPLAHRQEGQPGRASSPARSPSSHIGTGDRQGPDRLRLTCCSSDDRVPRRPAPRPPPALRHRQGRRRQDHRGRRPRRCSPPSTGKRTLVGEVDAKGNLADFFEVARDQLRAPRGRAGPVRHDDAHRGLPQGVPAAAAQDPARRPPRPARPHLRLRRQRRPGRQGGADRRQVPVGGPRAPLRPRRRRRRRHRSRHRPAGGAPGASASW